MSVFYVNQEMEHIKNMLNLQLNIRLYNTCTRLIEEFFSRKHAEGNYSVFVSKTGCYIVNVSALKKSKLKKLLKGLKLITTFYYKGSEQQC